MKDCSPKHRQCLQFLHLAMNRSQWSRGLWRRSTAARLLRLWVRIPPRAWMSICCECYVLSGRGLCDELITRPEESYRLWCVVVCDQETSWTRRPWPALGRRVTKTNVLQWITGLSHWFCFAKAQNTLLCVRLVCRYEYITDRQLLYLCMKRISLNATWAIHTLYGANLYIQQLKISGCE
jgi:hypothetical protein